MSTLHLVLCFSPIILLTAIAAVQMDLANYRQARAHRALRTLP